MSADIESSIGRVNKAATDLADGRMVVLVNRYQGGDEGDLLIAAEFADAVAINLMITKARGIVGLVLTPERCEDLELEPIGQRGIGSSLGDSAMVGIEAREGVTTGISAADRARTIAVAIDPATNPDDLIQPGHILPLRARSGGVLERAGRIEAAVELAKRAGLSGAAVVCQVMHNDGHMASGDDLEQFASENGLATVRVSEVAQARRASASKPARSTNEMARAMREVMGHFATGVSVVTALDAGGHVVGTTANAISSVSLDPPLVLACLDRNSETLAAIHDDRRFALNILSFEQRHHSDRFAAKGADVRAHEVAFSRVDSGPPVLPEALATIECDVEAMHPAGDHYIVVGHCRRLEHDESGVGPLLFYRGAFSRLHIEEDSSVPLGESG